MTLEEVKKIALEDTKKHGGDYVNFAGEEDDWFYFSCGSSEAPKYSSLPWAIRINKEGEIEELKNFILRQKISQYASKLN